VYARVYPCAMERRAVVVRTWVVIVIASVTLTGCAADDPRADDASAVMDDFLSADLPGCSAAAAVDGSVVWADHEGLADVATESPIESSTRFNFGSVSKQFTATAILALAEAGALHLDDLVSDHIDDLPAWAGEVTVRDLMHHTSGLRDTELLTLRSTAPEEYLRVLREGEGHRDDATEFGYANTNYILLAMIAERASGTPLAEWLAETIFDPLDLGLTLELQASGEDIATGYEEAAAPFRVAEDLTAAAGPSSVHGTPGELARWGVHYSRSTVPTEAALEAALLDAAPIPDSSGAAYGPGIAITPSQGLTHNGSDVGMLTFFGVSRDRTTTLVISCNAPLAELDGLSESLIDVWLGERFRE
jgi:CubicO group peptidase (beta-lactamase class C family)